MTQPKPSNTPSQIPPSAELPLRIVPTEERKPRKEEVIRDRESAREILEGEEDLPWVKPPKAPERGQS